MPEHIQLLNNFKKVGLGSNAWVSVHKLHKIVCLSDHQTQKVQLSPLFAHPFSSLLQQEPHSMIRPPPYFKAEMQLN